MNENNFITLSAYVLKNINDFENLKTEDIPNLKLEGEILATIAEVINERFAGMNLVEVKKIGSDKIELSGVDINIGKKLQQILCYVNMKLIESDKLQTSLKAENIDKLRLFIEWDN